MIRKSDLTLAARPEDDICNLELVLELLYARPVSLATPIDLGRKQITHLNLPNLVPEEQVRPSLLVPLNYLYKVPPKCNLDPALKEPRAWLDAVLSANLIPDVPPDDGCPVPGLTVADVDGGRLAGVAVKGHGEDFALVAGDIVRVEVYVTKRLRGVHIVWEGWLTCGRRDRLSRI